MAKNGNALLDRLKTSLPKVEPPSSDLGDSTIAPTPPLSDPGIKPLAPKLSVSLYPRDLSRLDEIKVFMQSRGFRNLSDSEALRLACRAVVIDDRFIDLYRLMQNEDGRRRTTKA